MRAVLAALLSLSALFSSSSKQTATPAPTLTATQFLQSSLQALTGGTVVSDATLTGTVESVAGSDNETGTATLKALAAGAARIDLSLPSGTRSEVRNTANGVPAGTSTGPDGVSHDIAFHNLLSEPAWFFPAFLVARGLTTSVFSATYVGHEDLNGQAVEHLAISQIFTLQTPSGVPTFSQLSQTDLFLDSSTFLPAVIRFNAHPDDNELFDIPIEVDLSDYRYVNGAQIPFHVQKLLNNGLVLDLQFQNTVINSGLSASSFSIQ